MTHARSDSSSGVTKEPEVRTGFIAGVTFGSRAVQYEVINGKAVFEGDIVLGDVEDLEEEARLLRGAPQVAALVVTTGVRYRWNKGVVPWDVDPALPTATQTNVA